MASAFAERIAQALKEAGMTDEAARDKADELLSGIRPGDDITPELKAIQADRFHSG
ncbi:hypothetical protein ABID21_001982 [Pseudorhizobium tarimense]|uniref:Uncharacterized protein n=2 Tax=Pseudorhizobium tarimense TaxID=1079109 RepID=A0ABV2H5N2_9HYPH|nr:hypothetical protein [Pseudorhizobium tarimense]MCJ8519290.1 hypothetical protein [Pseudorhizobium tarimense]